MKTRYEKIYSKLNKVDDFPKFLKTVSVLGFIQTDMIIEEGYAIDIYEKIIDDVLLTLTITRNCDLSSSWKLNSKLIKQ